MVGLFVLLLLFLLVAVMFMYYRNEKTNKQTSVPRKDLLLGYDFSKGSPWKSSSTTKETGKNPLKVVGEFHDQDTLEKIFRAPTDGGIEKKDIGTIVIDNNSPIDEDVEKDEGIEKKDIGTIVVDDSSPTDEDVEKDEGIEKKDIGTIVVDDSSPTDEDMEKKEVVAIIVEEDSPTDEDVEKDVGGKIPYTEFQKLLLQADSLSASCSPQKSDYGKGYHMGIQIHFNSGHRGSLPDHYSIAEIARSNGCRNVHAFARGYINGYMGLKPEYTD
jgi:hypothetical protein